MVKTIVSCPIFLPVHSVKLGRFVTNIDQPHENYHEPPATETPKAIVTSFSYTGYKQDIAGARFGFNIFPVGMVLQARGIKSPHRTSLWHKLYSRQIQLVV